MEKIKTIEVRVKYPHVWEVLPEEYKSSSYGFCFDDGLLCVYRQEDNMHLLIYNSKAHKWVSV